MDDDDELRLRKIAERRADAKLAFRSHAIVYVAVNAGLAAINLTTSPQYFWFGWPLVGWGIGLLAHGLATFGYAGGERERMVEAELARLRKQGVSGR